MASRIHLFARSGVSDGHSASAVFPARVCGVAALLFAIAGLSACGGTNDKVPAGEFVAPAVEFQIVFEDNFDGAELNAANWNVDEGDGCPVLCGWGNDELQVYQADNVTVSGGILRIEGRREAGGGYTSGRINTRGKFDFEYGRVEVSARIPGGQGTWPAIWLLHTPLDRLVNGEQFGAYGPWPMSGEIDIMEAFNYGVNGNQSTKSTTHYGLPIQPFDGTGSTTNLSVNADMTFHEYAVEWEKGRIRFFVDGQHFQTQIIDEYYTYYPGNEDGLYDPLGSNRLGLEDAPFDQLFHLIINFAIGGNPVGDPDMNTVFPQAMEIDYVRVYECANSNADTRRGCGNADPSVTPLTDFDGSPLEGANTAKPYIESLDLYLDAPETITVEFGQDSATNTLQVGGFTGPGATVVSDPAFQDPDDAENTVWHVSVQGDVANVFLASEDLTADAILDTGFDLSSAAVPAPVGELVFDMQVNSMTPGTDLIVKLDSGFPNVGEVVIPEADLAIGEWKTYSAKFADFLANPGFVDCCGGQGVDLENVVNPFVFEVVNGDADVYLDNIGVTNACYVVGTCKARARTKGLPDVVIFEDDVDPAWDVGIAGADSGSGFANYTDGTNPANKANWAIIDDPDDPARGRVIDVTFNDSGEQGVLFIQSTSTVDLSAYSAGAVVFDIIVTDYGNNTSGMTFKADCIFPCTSGDKNIGVIGDGAWETVQVPVSTLTATGLDLSVVNTPINIFPVITDQTGTIRYRVDNIRWIAEATAPPLAQIDLPVTFDDPAVDYTLIDFGGTGTSIVDDPAGGSNRVAQTVHNGGPFAGTVIGTDAGFATPIPFTPAGTTLSLRVYSPAAGIPIMLKVEDSADPNVFAEIVATTTAANAWETLTYDYVGAIDPLNVSYEKAVLFFNFPNAGDGSTYFWDDLAFGAGGGPGQAQVDLPVTFDAGNVDYDLVDFGGNTTTLVMDPNNMANTVASSNKPPGSQFFAGTTVGGTNGLAGAVPFTATETSMTVRVYSPDAGIPVRLKVEDANDPGISVEAEVLTTIADDWEVLTYDFSNQVPGTAALNIANTYDKASIFFNFGTDGTTAGDKTYLWEDVAFGATP